MSDNELQEIPPDRLPRLVRLGFAIGAAACAVVSAYALLQAVRGDPDSYAHENLRTFTLTGALALLMSREFVRSELPHWRLLGATFVLLAWHIWLTYADAGFNWITGVAVVIIIGGIGLSAHTLIPRRGTSREEWRATILTPAQVRRVSAGFAITVLGLTLSIFGLVNVREAPWGAIAVVGVTTVSLAAGGLLILRVAWRIGRDPSGPEQP